MTGIQRPPAGSARPGITLLEVLISIGILSIGLASVVALVPAGRAQASRAVILDRAAILAANVLADAATAGFLRPESVSNGNFRPLILDTSITPITGGVSGGLGTMGVYSPAVPASPAAAGVQNLFLQLRDDIVVAPPSTPDDPPTNAFTDGARSFEGRMSALLCLQRGTPGPLHRMSVIVFHRRDTALPILSGTLSIGVLTISPASGLGSRTVPDIIRPGVVAYTNSPTPQFHQVTSAGVRTVAAATTSTSGTYTVWMTFSTGTAFPTPPVAVQFLPDSVGLAERPFTPETTGAYTQ